MVPFMPTPARSFLGLAFPRTSFLGLGKTRSLRCRSDARRSRLFGGQGSLHVAQLTTTVQNSLALINAIPYAYFVITEGNGFHRGTV